MEPYPITDTQKDQLLTSGYVRLPGAFRAPLLDRWRELAARLEAEALEAYRRGEPVGGAAVIEDPGGPCVARIDDIHRVDPDAVLDLLACPGMMAVARDLCGRGTVPMQLDILFKHQHPHTAILWHQGAPHPRGFPYLNVGLYLDDAPAGDGCLRYVPGTQHELQDLAGLSGEHGWDLPGVVEQPAMAGDILVQDMMVLHGSQPKRSPGVRRTIYVELRPVDGILESAQQSQQWAQLRQRWMGLVLRRSGRAAWPDEWLGDIPTDLASDAEEFAQILANPEPPIPAVYARFPVVHDDYPVPADLRGA